MSIINDFSQVQLPSDAASTGTERVLDANFIDENQSWKAARELVDGDINNIAAWDQLITLTEQLLNKYPAPSQTIKTIISSTFDELLSRFPLFFGYWKKYISITYQINGTAESIKVLSQSLDYFPNSLELWIDYLTISISNASESGADKQKLRLLFERAADLVGLQFLSHPFWDKFLEFENNDVDASLRILLKLIRIPLHQYAKYYQSFLTLKESIDIQKLVSQDNIEIPSDVEDPRAFVNEYFNKVFGQTQTFVGEIWTFESQIKQSFFNLSPLPEEDFTTWEKYLSFLISKHDTNPTDLNKSITISTFERCLVPTALSPKFWYKYLGWVLNEFPSEFDRLNLIYKRAINLFIPIKFIDIRLNYALFLQVHKQDPILIHDTYLSIISQNKSETKPLINYIKFISRLNNKDHNKTCDYLEILLANYFKRSTSKGEIDFNGTRLLKLLTDKTIAVIIAELIKINWYYLDNKTNTKKLLNFYSKFDSLNDSVIFWSLSYTYYKEHSEFTVLSRVIKFIKYESALPLSVINSILLDYSEFLAQNFPEESAIPHHYDQILELEYDAAHPFHYRINKDPKLYKNAVRESGHAGVFIQKPEITNSIIEELAPRHQILPLPTFKNVERASLPIEHTQEEEE